MEEVDMTIAFEATKKQFIDDLDVKVEKGITEKASADFLKRLIENIETEEDLLALQSLATLYKKSGFVFTPVQEKLDDTIKYLTRNEEKSFDQGGIHHKLIVGDNYPALQNLLITHRGQIDVIYIDPPYGKDDMGEFADTNYDNAISRDNLLSMLHPRLQLAKQLLSDEGVIFCSIDDRNQAYVRGLFDEVFGEENFITQFTWEKKKKGSFLSSNITTVLEYVICYAKNKPTFNGLVGEIKTKAETYPCVNAPNHREERTIPAGTPSKYREKNVTKPAGTVISNNTMSLVLKNDLVIENGVLAQPLTIEGNWRYSQESMDKFAADGDLYITQDLYIRRVVREERNKNLKNLLLRVGTNPDEATGSFDVNDLHASGWGSNEDADEEIFALFGDQSVFAFSKPVQLIAKLICAVRKPNATVLDFFAGSGTTGQAVLELNKKDDGNRQFILCTSNEEGDGFIADNVTTKRLKRVMTGECYDGTKDFKWLDNNEPYGDSLDVYDIESVSSFASAQPSAIDVIDEANYGKSFDNVNDKIAWVCQNFHVMQKSIPPYGEVEFDA